MAEGRREHREYLARSSPTYPSKYSREKAREHEELAKALQQAKARARRRTR